MGSLERYSDVLCVGFGAALGTLARAVLGGSISSCSRWLAHYHAPYQPYGELPPRPPTHGSRQRRRRYRLAPAGSPHGRHRRDRRIYHLQHFHSRDSWAVFSRFRSLRRGRAFSLESSARPRVFSPHHESGPHDSILDRAGRRRGRSRSLHRGHGGKPAQ